MATSAKKPMRNEIKSSPDLMNELAETDPSLHKAAVCIIATVKEYLQEWGQTVMDDMLRLSAQTCVAGSLASTYAEAECARMNRTLEHILSIITDKTKKPATTAIKGQKSINAWFSEQYALDIQLRTTFPGKDIVVKCSAQKHSPEYYRSMGSAVYRQLSAEQKEKVRAYRTEHAPIVEILDSDNEKDSAAAAAAAAVPAATSAAKAPAGKTSKKVAKKIDEYEASSADVVADDAEDDSDNEDDSDDVSDDSENESTENDTSEQSDDEIPPSKKKSPMRKV